MKQHKLETVLKRNLLSSLTGSYDFMNSYLIKKPIQDILVGFCFERSSGKDEKYIWFFSMPLYLPHNVISLTFGSRIQTDNRGQLWDFSDAQIDDTLKALLPQLFLHEKTINELEVSINFYNTYYKKKQTNLRIHEAITCTACWLELPTMRNEIESCIKFIENESDISIPWVKEILDNMKLLQMQKSNEEILNLLKNWKENTLKELKLK